MKYKFDQESYQNILASIFERFPSVQTSGFKEAYKPGLDGMMQFDSRLGHPHSAYRTLHIAGTNGKGSTANMLAAALSAAGLKVGLYTSPHILDFRERMRVNGEMVPAEYVYDFFMEWNAVFDELHLSFFEITTGLAFRWFADSQVDVAVIETGLGGRLDSTNIILPDLSIITSIGLDHCAMLGGTRAEIAAEKAGIIKAGVPALIGEIHEETRPVFEAKAERMHASLYFAPEMEPEGWGRHREILEKMDLQGAYQEANLRTVLCALELLGTTLPGEKEKMLEGIEQTAARMHFHGRWEKLSDHPYVLCDIGHNAHALAHNFAQLREMMGSGRFQSLLIVYGIMADKNLEDILPLMPADATYLLTQAKTRRALDCNKLGDVFKSYSLPGETERKFDSGKLFVINGVKEAVSTALQMARSQENGEALIYIGGSNFIVSEALTTFKDQL